MTTIPPNTKLYRPTPDNRIETLTYKRTKGTHMILDNEAGVTVRLHKDKYQTLCHSKRVLLAEMEERMRNDLDRIHEQMRALRIAFNPVQPVDVIYQKYDSHITEVHKYCISTGRHLESFKSMRDAYLKLGLDAKKGTGISKACRKIRPSAYGYKWSYERVKYLAV
mgnify:FL=1